MNRIRYDRGPWLRLPDYPLPAKPKRACGLPSGAEYRGINLCERRHKETAALMWHLFQLAIQEGRGMRPCPAGCHVELTAPARAEPPRASSPEVGSPS
jgi:hypothetical protein